MDHTRKLAENEFFKLDLGTRIVNIDADEVSVGVVVELHALRDFPCLEVLSTSPTPFSATMIVAAFVLAETPQHFQTAKDHLPVMRLGKVLGLDPRLRSAREPPTCPAPLLQPQGFSPRPQDMYVNIQI